MARKPKARKRGRRRGSSARANADLSAHIESLGLATVSAYRAWCRDHGFTGALNKSWQERRRERAVSEKELDEEAAGAGLELHVERLGLPDEAAYQAWCRQHDLSDALNKGEAQRKKELALADRLQGEAVLSRSKRSARRLPDTISAIHDGSADPADLRQPALERIAYCFDLLDTQPERDAYLSLLLHVETHARLFGTKPALSILGARDGNTFIDALAAVACRHADWIRPLDDWRPDSHNARRQFGALVRHLICKYDVPAFADVAWFHGLDAGARRRQAWFTHIGTGGNIRRADIPLGLTKRMAHLFLQAPNNHTFEEAFRRAQILALGGEEPLVRAVNATFLGESFENEDFWGKVIHFFVNNPMLDPDEVGPIVDYIRYQKYTQREVPGPDGGVVLEDPPQPNFSVKGRSMDKLLRQVDAWHRQLARETRLPHRTWAPSGINDLDRSVDDERWTIRELLSTKELVQEGRQMHHCVGSYANNCQKGNISVWSMQVEDGEAGTQRVMTIAVQNKAKRINQARGRFNALPSGKTPSGKRASLERRYQGYLRQSRKILHAWRVQEGLTMSSRT